jgi:hypothetical protein
MRCRLLAGVEHQRGVGLEFATDDVPEVDSAVNREVCLVCLYGCERLTCIALLAIGEMFI